jgi:hypothetical protein
VVFCTTLPISGGGAGFEGAGRDPEPCEPCVGGVDRGGEAEDEPLFFAMNPLRDVSVKIVLLAGFFYPQ